MVEHQDSSGHGQTEVLRTTIWRSSTSCPPCIQTLPWWLPVHFRGQLSVHAVGWGRTPSPKRRRRKKNPEPAQDTWPCHVLERLLLMKWSSDDLPELVQESLHEKVAMCYTPCWRRMVGSKGRRTCPKEKSQQVTSVRRQRIHVLELSNLKSPCGEEEQVDLVTQWNRVMESIRPRRGILGDVFGIRARRFRSCHQR